MINNFVLATIRRPNEKIILQLVDFRWQMSAFKSAIACSKLWGDLITSHNSDRSSLSTLISPVWS